MTTRKYSSRSQQTTLTGALTSSGTSATVVSGTALLGGVTISAGETFTVVIDPDTALEEIVDVTAVSTNTLTITRGIDGSTGQAHSAGAVVRHMAVGRDYREANTHIEATTGHGATGAVVGINSAIASLGSSAGGQSGSIGLGFAIPINQAKKTAEQLIKTGSATYPIMGIAVDTRYTGNGALISSEANGVTSGGPADKAGIKAGDLIIAIDGVEIASSDELIVAIRSHNVGDKVKIKFKRNAVTREVSVTLAASKK
mgnify:CR=1 FL=1